MKKLFCCLLMLTLTGCVSILMPSYIQDKHPYQRTFYIPFDQAYKTTMKVFNDTGWAIEKESEPMLFERDRALGEKRQQVLLFTEVHQSYFFVGSQYTRINVYLRDAATNETEVEIRYVKVTTLTFKSFYSYKNDRVVNGIFQKIEAGLDL